MRCINKAYRDSSYNANYIAASNGTKLDMYTASTATRRDKEVLLLLHNRTGDAAPALPTAGNASAWEAAIAVNRLLPPATRQRPELVDVELVSNPPHQHDFRKRQLVLPSSPCDSSPNTISSSIAAKRKQRCNQHGRFLNGGAPWCHLQVMTSLHRPMMPFWHHLKKEKKKPQNI